MCTPIKLQLLAGIVVQRRVFLRRRVGGSLDLVKRRLGLHLIDEECSEAWTSGFESFCGQTAHRSGKAEYRYITTTEKLPSRGQKCPCKHRIVVGPAWPVGHETGLYTVGQIIEAPMQMMTLKNPSCQK